MRFCPVARLAMLTALPTAVAAAPPRSVTNSRRLMERAFFHETLA